MMKPDFVITCLGLFLIIVVALIIGNPSEIEGFSYSQDFETNYVNLNNYINNIKKYSNQTQKSSIDTLWNEIAKHVSNTCTNGITYIIFGREQQFVDALNNIDNYAKLININVKEVRDLQSSIANAIAEIKEIIVIP